MKNKAEIHFMLGLTWRVARLTCIFSRDNMDRSVGCRKKLTCRGRGGSRCSLTSQTSRPAGSGGCRRCTRSSPATASDPERRLRLPVRTGDW